MKRPFVIIAGLISGLIGTLLFLIMPAYLANRSTLDIALTPSAAPVEQPPPVQASQGQNDIDKLSELARTMMEAKLLPQGSTNDAHSSIKLKGTPGIDPPQMTSNIPLASEAYNLKIDETK